MTRPAGRVGKLKETRGSSRVGSQEVGAQHLRGRVGLDQELFTYHGSGLTHLTRSYPREVIRPVNSPPVEFGVGDQITTGTCNTDKVQQVGHSKMEDCFHFPQDFPDVLQYMLSSRAQPSSHTYVRAYSIRGKKRDNVPGNQKKRGEGVLHD